MSGGVQIERLEALLARVLVRKAQPRQVVAPAVRAAQVPTPSVASPVAPSAVRAPEPQARAATPVAAAPVATPVRAPEPPRPAVAPPVMVPMPTPVAAVPARVQEPVVAPPAPRAPEPPSNELPDLDFIEGSGAEGERRPSLIPTGSSSMPPAAVPPGTAEPDSGEFEIPSTPAPRPSMIPARDAIEFEPADEDAHLEIDRAPLATATAPRQPSQDELEIVDEAPAPRPPVAAAKVSPPAEPHRFAPPALGAAEVRVVAPLPAPSAARTFRELALRTAALKISARSR